MFIGYEETLSGYYLTGQNDHGCEILRKLLDLPDLNGRIIEEPKCQ